MAKPTQEKRTWTQHTFTCGVCRKLCYTTQEAIDENRKYAWYEEGTTDAQIAEGFEFCLGCIIGEHVEGEKVVPEPQPVTSAESQQYIDGDDDWKRGPVWELRNLTPDDVRNLDAASDFLADAPEEWGDTSGTIAKIRALVDAVKSAGVNVVKEGEEG